VLKSTPDMSMVCGKTLIEGAVSAPERFLSYVVTIDVAG